MTYFHRRKPTIIGAKAFHGPVRDGKSWGHFAMVVRQRGWVVLGSATRIGLSVLLLFEPLPIFMGQRDWKKVGLVLYRPTPSRIAVFAIEALRKTIGSSLTGN